MEQIQPDLWQTRVENPAPGLTTHAYLLIRSEGNILFYNTGHEDEIAAMEELGGVWRQYLSHRDELGDSLKVIGERYGAGLAMPPSARISPDIGRRTSSSIVARSTWTRSR